MDLDRDVNGFWMILMDFDGVFNGFVMDLNGFWWILMDFGGDLPGFE